MKEQFVPYDLALELKELGFKEECLGSYYHAGRELDINEYINHGEYTVLAPLWQQAFDFFRKKHNLNGEIVYNILELNGYWWQVNSKEGDTWSSKNETFPYEEAQKQCLIKLIEICKKKE